MSKEISFNEWLDGFSAESIDSAINKVEERVAEGRMKPEEFDSIFNACTKLRHLQIELYHLVDNQ